MVTENGFVLTPLPQNEKQKGIKRHDRYTVGRYTDIAVRSFKKLRHSRMPEICNTEIFVVGTKYVA